MGMYDEASKRVGSGLYLKLDAGEKRIRLIDHPYVSHRPGFKPEDPYRTVFTWPVWNYEEERVQVLEQGPGLFKQIAAIAKVYGEDMPMGCDLVITTTGSGIETRRTIVAAPHLGEMPNSGALRKDPKYPNIAELSKGVSLQEFSKGKDPGKPVTLDASTPAQEGGDTILKDIPDNGDNINLDDIPF